MTWTYSGDPSTSPLDEVRFLCGDTEEKYGFVQNEEIEYYLSKVGNVRAAAIKSCGAIIRKIAKQVDYTIGPETVKAGQRLEHYRKVLADLKGEGISDNAAPSWDDYTTRQRNKGYIFDVGMHDIGGGL